MATETVAAAFGLETVRDARNRWQIAESGLVTP